MFGAIVAATEVIRCANVPLASRLHYIPGSWAKYLVKLIGMMLTEEIKDN